MILRPVMEALRGIRNMTQDDYENYETLKAFYLYDKVAKVRFPRETIAREYVQSSIFNGFSSDFCF